MRLWDPLGVESYPTATDEYDSFALEIGEKLVGGVWSKEEIASYLLKTEVETFTLHGRDKTRADVAAGAIWDRFAPKR